LLSQGGADNLPVGTILAYTGSLADIPTGWHLCDGTEGTPNLLDGRFLEGNATIGIFREPGLPNLYGNYCTSAFDDSSNYTKFANGVFTSEGWHIGSVFVAQPRATIVAAGGVTFDASLYNPIYGASNTVQPKAYTVLFIMKIK